MMPTNDSYQKEIVLELEEGSEHKLQINTDIDIATDIMYPVFHAAEVAVAGIIRSSEQFSSAARSRNDLYGYANNIIAFSGQRGQGKTSAMLSFSGALSEYDRSKSQKLHLSQAEQFYVLDPIDPSMLQEDSALNVILSRLYQIARKTMKKLQTSENVYASTKIAPEQSSREMIVQFQRCLSGVRALSGPSETLDVDDFESLSTLVDGLRLKAELYKLVQSFLRLHGMDARSGYIVIQLDDTDLQLKNAYNVLDDICKYLTLPNVIILMATDMEQLQLLVEQHYLKELWISCRKGLVDTEMLQKMAIKYLDKLIPISQVIRLPSLSSSFESCKPVQIKVIREEKAVGKIEDIQKKFFAMIYEKTGIAYVGNDEELHSIMPTTLRGLRHFYRFLNETLEDCGKMPSVSELSSRRDGQDVLRCKEQYRAWIARREQNLMTFENYFLDDWCSGHLPQEQKHILRSISEAPQDQMIRYADMFLNSFDLPLSAAKGEQPYTYCSLFHRVNALTKDVGQFKDASFAAALKTILSIQLQRISLKDRMAFLDAWDGSAKFHPVFNMLKKHIGHLPFSDAVKTAPAKEAGGVKEVWIDPESSALNVSTLFMEGLVPGIKDIYYDEETDPDRDSYYIDKAEEYQNYAVTVCCNLELQEYIGSYIKDHLDALPRLGQQDFGGNVSEYYKELMTALTGRCRYLYQEETGESIFEDVHSTQFLLPRGMPAALKNLGLSEDITGYGEISDCIEKLDSLIDMIRALKRPEDFGQDMGDAVESVIESIIMIDEFDVESHVVKKSFEIIDVANKITYSDNTPRQAIAGLCTRLKNLRKLLAGLLG